MSEFVALSASEQLARYLKQELFTQPWAQGRSRKRKKGANAKHKDQGVNMGSKKR